MASSPRRRAATISTPPLGAHGFGASSKGEILNLRWSQLDLREGAIKLSAEDTKTNFPRTVYLTERVLQMLKAIPRRLGTEYVFVNPETGTRW
jgi:integrase